MYVRPLSHGPSFLKLSVQTLHSKPVVLVKLTQQHPSTTNIATNPRNRQWAFLLVDKRKCLGSRWVGTKSENLGQGECVWTNANVFGTDESALGQGRRVGTKSESLGQGECVWTTTNAFGTDESAWAKVIEILCCQGLTIGGTNVLPLSHRSSFLKLSVQTLHSKPASWSN